MPVPATTGGSMRFSSTVSVANIPRSSGTKPIPAWAVRWSGTSIMSRPSKKDLALALANDGP
jgi:hypothetical protein